MSACSGATGGVSVPVADHGGAPGEAARPGDAGGAQGGVGGERGVAAVEADERGHVGAEHVLDQGAVHGPVAEHVVVEVPGEQPAVEAFGAGEGGAQPVEVLDGTGPSRADTAFELALAALLAQARTLLP
ncbi:hypothetical protein [Kitasatospora griseola]|uniref:hypothetical protein n=1 Tax=Kitasatospora griseola TaxID=2064 RepID=UPI0038003564